jgi:hypothetical protein
MVIQIMNTDGETKIPGRLSEIVIFVSNKQHAKTGYNYKLPAV